MQQESPISNALLSVNIKEIETEYRKRFLFYKPHDKQKAFHAAGADAVERLFIGGNRSGKSYGGYVETAMHATGIYSTEWNGRKFNHPTNIWVVCPSYKSSREIAQMYLLGGSDEQGKLTNGLIVNDLIARRIMLNGIRDTVDYISVPHISGGLSRIYFKSAEQGRKEFQGVRCHVILMDEEPPYDVYRECMMRLADVDGKGQGIMMLTMTPLKGMTELLKHFLFTRDGEERAAPQIIVDGKFHVQVSWDDNPYLSEATKTQYRLSTPAYELEAREKGIPLVGTGLVYQVPESAFVVPPIEIPKHWHHIVGLDLGFNPAPTAAVFCAWDKDNDTLYIYREYYVTQNTPQQHVYNWQVMDCLWMPFIADPSARIGSTIDGTKAIEEYRKSGKQLFIAKYGKESSVTKVLERIRNGKFKVFSNCYKFLEEWRSYARDEKGKIMKGNDHLMNALEFVMTDGLPIARTRIEREFDYKSSVRSAII